MLRQPLAGIGLGAALYSAAARRLPWPRRPAAHERPLLAAALSSAVAEELLWRGAALQLLRGAGTVPALAVLALAFAAAHRPRAAGQALATQALLGLALGAAASRPRGLVTAVAAHATYDLLVLLEEAPP